MDFCCFLLQRFQGILDDVISFWYNIVPKWLWLVVCLVRVSVDSRQAHNFIQHDMTTVFLEWLSVHFSMHLQYFQVSDRSTSDPILQTVKSFYWNASHSHLSHSCNLCFSPHLIFFFYSERLEQNTTKLKKTPLKIKEREVTPVEPEVNQKMNCQWVLNYQFKGNCYVTNSKDLQRKKKMKRGERRKREKKNHHETQIVICLGLSW